MSTPSLRHSDANHSPARRDKSVRLQGQRVLVFFLLMVSGPVYAQQCTAHTDGQHAQAFDDNQDGTLTDIVSGLTWMRCSLGQQWNGTSCEGQATPFTWQASRTAVIKLNRFGGYLGYTDWRLPRLSELAGIVDIHCKNPRINLQLFPNTPATHYWTASNKAKSLTEAYVLDFASQGVSVKDKYAFARVRLLRGRNF